MADSKMVSALAAKYDCEIELVDISPSASSHRYVAIVSCHHRDNDLLAELVKELQNSLPEIDRVVLDVTPPRHK